MTKSVEVSARTVDEAIKQAIAQLGIDESIAVIEVLEEGESGGLFGFGRKPALVRVSYDLNDLSGEPASATDTLTDVEMPAVLSDEEDQATDEELADNRVTAERDVVPDDADDDEVTAQAAATDEPEASNVADSERQEEAEQTAVQFVAKVMQSLGIHGRMSSFYAQDGSLHLDIVGDDVGNAIGRRGETLNALQYLTTLAVNKDKGDYIRVVLDIGGYRVRRERSLIRDAKRSAERVARTGRADVLPAMPSAERRQIHLALKSFDGVVTYSEGDEPERYVVIAPDDER